MIDRFNIEGNTYALNLEKLMEFIITPMNRELDGNTTLVQCYENNHLDSNPGLSFTKKEISENKTNINELTCSMRYNVIMEMLNILTTPLTDENGMLISLLNLESWPFGHALAFNTLLEMGVIYQIEEETEDYEEE